MPDDIAEWAEELHTTASSAMAPTTMVDVFGQNVEITGGDVDEATWIDRFDAAHPIAPSPLVPLVGVVALLVLLIGLLLVPVVGSVGFMVVLAGATVATWFGWRHWQKRARSQESAIRREVARRRTARQIAEAAKRIAAENAEAQAVWSTIDDSLKRVTDQVRVLSERAPV